MVFYAARDVLLRAARDVVAVLRDIYIFSACVTFSSQGVIDVFARPVMCFCAAGVVFRAARGDVLFFACVVFFACMILSRPVMFLST